MARTHFTLENQNIDIHIHEFKLIAKNSGLLKACFNLRYGDVITKSWKIIQDSKDGRFFMCPASRRGGDRFFEHFCIVDKNVRMAVEKMAIDLYADYIHGEVVDDSEGEPGV